MRQEGRKKLASEWLQIYEPLDYFIIIANTNCAMTFTEKHYERTFHLVLVFHFIKNLAHIPFPIHGFFSPSDTLIMYYSVTY